MPSVTVSVRVTTLGTGYNIVIDPYRAHLTPDNDVIEWDSDCEVMIEMAHPEHFPRFVQHGYGTHHNTEHLAVSKDVAPNGTYHYKINILVDDPEDGRRGHYKNLICIDPDYKVDR